MHGSGVASIVLARLRKESPETLADVKLEELKDYDLSKVDPDMAPSELKKLSEAIRKKRNTGEGLSKEDMTSLMRRIGKK